jgi:hypothetical protein
MTILHPDIERLALLGWRMYPASAFSRAACIKDPGASATCELGKLQAWSSTFSDCNWRMVCEGSRVWALDVDVPSEDHTADGVAALTMMVAQHGPIPPRPMTRSGGGGMALFFRHRGEPIHGATGWPMPGIDPRRGKLSVTVPPSIHVRTRRPYQWAVAPWELSPPDAPAWLLKAVAPPPVLALRLVSYNIATAHPTRRRNYAEAALRNAIGRVASAGEGQRHAEQGDVRSDAARPRWRSFHARSGRVHGRRCSPRRSGRARGASHVAQRASVWRM